MTSLLAGVFTSVRTIAIKVESGEISGSLTFLNSLAASVPSIHADISEALQRHSTQFDQLDFQRIRQVLGQLAKLGTTLLTMKIARDVAWELTQRYRRQLDLIGVRGRSSSHDEDEKSARGPVDSNSNGTEKPELAGSDVKGNCGIHQFARYALLSMLEELLNGDVTVKVDCLKSELIAAVMRPISLRPRAFLSVPLGETMLQGSLNSAWTVIGAYQSPFVETPDEKMYGHAGSNKTYGIRYASEAEARAWGLIPVEEFQLSPSESFGSGGSNPGVRDINNRSEISDSKNPAAFSANFKFWAGDA